VTRQFWHGTPITLATCCAGQSQLALTQGSKTRLYALSCGFTGGVNEDPALLLNTSKWLSQLSEPVQRGSGSLAW
jgi:hypothetical protein